MLTLRANWSLEAATSGVIDCLLAALGRLVVTLLGMTYDHREDIYLIDLRVFMTIIKSISMRRKPSIEKLMFYHHI